jgi:hypothetical protein
VLQSAIVDEWLVDDAVDAYVFWRERRAEVWETYERWSIARPISRSDETFAAYRTALDREELAAESYADRVARLTASLAARS